MSNTLKIRCLAAIIGAIFGSTLRLEAQGCPTPPPASCPCWKTPTNTVSGTSIDMDTLGPKEGGNRLTTYTVDKVTADPSRPNSGVTVGIGVDLGSKGAGDLLKMGVDSSTVTALTPYLGLKGQDAIDYNNAHPLTLSSDAAAQLNSSVINYNAQSLITAFNNAAANYNFQDLPWQAQTVLYDLWYNMGPLGPTSSSAKGTAPGLWTQMTTGDWQGALSNLADFTTQPASALQARAKSDGQLLQGAYNTCALQGVQ